MRFIVLKKMEVVGLSELPYCR